MLATVPEGLNLFTLASYKWLLSLIVTVLFWPRQYNHDFDLPEIRRLRLIPGFLGGQLVVLATERHYTEAYITYKV